MNRRLAWVLVIGALLVSLGLAADHATAVPVTRNMEITGEIAKMDNGYIIRGTVPAEIFTVLNPLPASLDGFVKSGKTVHLKVRIVSGDNVEIEKIDGKPYGQSGAGDEQKSGKKGK